MKTLKLIAAGIILLITSTSNAQLSINLNIGNAPVYHNNTNVAVGYYYLPDIQSYYDVRANQYIYLNRGNWVRSRNLPTQYRNYNYKTGYKVVLNDYHGNEPYRNYKNDHTKYYVGYRGSAQKVVLNRNNNTVVYNNNKNYKYNGYNHYDKKNNHRR
ncbi:hypothetical protein [Flavobacterium sp. PL002]|uniref:hypothetical protein n=1 Tax=Flavobacterium sp. PL002 TaxID=1897058 RepID=UPI001787C6A7|nr:hypothetical protein [Flavobacterium sp. PL002]MBE0391869.1 hypothetical protein [Flavobacterium sp. PL002]